MRFMNMIKYTCADEEKEIGIRKVLGSPVVGIVRLLSMESLKTIIISMAIAFPLTHWIVNEWLASFVYKSPGGIRIFYYNSVGNVICILCCH